MLILYGLYRGYRSSRYYLKLRNPIIILLLSFIAGYLFSCKKVTRDPYSDTPTSGRIRIAVDENYQPIVEDELQVFKSIYPYAEITPEYLPQLDAFKLLFNDSVRFLLTDRGLTPQEIKDFNARKLFPREVVVATDAIALIVNPANPDSMMTVNQLKNIMTGKTKRWKDLDPANPLNHITVVFDNQNSGTVRYVKDSLCEGATLSSNLTALSHNPEVIHYVGSNKEALGIIGVCWISNRNDPKHLSFLNEIKVLALSIEQTSTWDNTYRPFQAYISLRYYPLARKVYIINTEPRNGLNTGFASFIAGEKGQRIILKAGIVPANSPTRIVDVHNSDVLQ